MNTVRNRPAFQRRLVTKLSDDEHHRPSSSQPSAPSRATTRPESQTTRAARSSPPPGRYQQPPLYYDPDDRLPIMKPVVSAMHAWSCTVISVFAIVILSVLGGLYSSGHEEFVGDTEGPEPAQGKEIASTIFTAVIVYAGFLLFCGLQGVLHVRENRRGAIAL